MPKPKLTNVRGTPMWMLDLRSTGHGRKYFATEKQAELYLRHHQNDTALEHDQWLRLPQWQRAGVIRAWSRCDAMGVTLDEVLDHYERTVESTKPQNLRGAIDALIESKRAARCSQAYIANLLLLLNQFAHGREQMLVSSIGPADCKEWALSGSAQYQATRMSRLSSLLSFCVRQGWLAKNPCSSLEKIRHDYDAPSVVTPEQAAQLVTKCHQKLKPWLVLGLFCGLRPEEADSTTWDDIRSDHIVVAAGKIRTSRRIVYPHSNSMKLLLSCRDGGQLPIPNSSRRKLQRQLRESIGWDEWPKDILRHSAASYWLAAEPDAARIALQLGNSPKVLLKHYRELVTKQDAERFWAVTGQPCGSSASTKPA